MKYTYRVNNSGRGKPLQVVVSISQSKRGFDNLQQRSPVFEKG